MSAKAAKKARRQVEKAVAKSIGPLAKQRAKWAEEWEESIKKLSLFKRISFAYNLVLGNRKKVIPSKIEIR